MTDHAQHALALITRHWGDVDHVVADDGRCWVRLRSYPVPPGWTSDRTTVVFAIPDEAATAPYGFYVPRTLLIKNGDKTTTPTSHYTHEAQGVPAPFDGGWAMFSWGPVAWTPQDDIVVFVRSFRERLEGLE